jgi:hypothetical protein
MKNLPRKTVAVIAGVLAALVIGVLSFYSASSAEGRLDTLRAQHEEMLAMSEELLSLRSRVAAVGGRAGLTRVGGIQQAVDEVLTPMGLKGKIKSVKRIDASADEERAELSLKDVDMNEMVNVLYAFKNVPIPIVIKKAELKTSFQKPGRLDMTMTLSLVKK